MDSIPFQWPDIKQITSTRSLVRSFLLLLNLVLFLLMLWVWSNAPQMVSVYETPETQTAPLQLPASPLRVLSLEHYQELLERPLFWSERRATKSASVVDAATPSLPLTFVLIGVVVSPQSSYALLSKTGSNEVIKAQPGDVVEGWVVESLTAGSVNLSQGGEKRHIVLEEERLKGR